MPFDGRGLEGRIDILDKMDKVIDLLATEDRWCKQQLRAYDGRRCILGAMMAADATIALKEPVLMAIKEVTGRDYLRIEMFNDHPLTNHALMMQVLGQARSNIANGVTVPAPPPAPARSSWQAPLARLRRLFA
jgi:hypothetical protein